MFFKFFFFIQQKKEIHTGLTLEGE